MKKLKTKAKCSLWTDPCSDPSPAPREQKLCWVCGIQVLPQFLAAELSLGQSSAFPGLNPSSALSRALQGGSGGAQEPQEWGQSNTGYCGPLWPAEVLGPSRPPQSQGSLPDPSPFPSLPSFPAAQHPPCQQLLTGQLLQHPLGKQKSEGNPFIPKDAHTLWGQIHGV